MTTEFYNLSANNPRGEIINFDDLKGKVVLIINTATKCGFTPQLHDLEELHIKYKEKGLVVIGFPCNQFLNQEPLTNEKIEDYCQINYGVTFSLTEKVDVNGTNAHPVFKFLKQNLSGFFGNSIKWNFTKFLINKDGKPIKRYAPNDKINKIEKDLIKLL
ncbi:MAG: glutathione peroxidase [Solirubrobacteraceae bacterium]